MQYRINSQPIHPKTSEIQCVSASNPRITKIASFLFLASASRQRLVARQMTKFMHSEGALARPAFHSDVRHLM